MSAAIVRTPGYAANPAPEQPSLRFVDADDGWFDVSGFLDSAYGFVPIIAPITNRQSV